MEKLKSDANSEEVNKIIQQDIKYAVKSNQIGTPIMVVGDKFEMGIPSDGYTGLKKWIIENGGKQKHLFGK